MASSEDETERAGWAAGGSDTWSSRGRADSGHTSEHAHMHMHMVTDSQAEIVFTRLPQVDAADLIALMNDPRVRRHLPLARGVFGPAECDQFVRAKERIWAEHGYGPWAFVIRGEFAGWGGLQPEGDDIDLGLVLRPKFWGWGPALYARLAAAAFEDLRAASIIILLPPSRAHVSGVLRLGFRLDGEIDIAGERFFRYRQTATNLAPARACAWPSEPGR